MSKLEYSLLAWAICLSHPILLSSAEPEISEHLIRDRTAVERVYYENRIGRKAPFEEHVTQDSIVGKINLAAKKEAILDHRYNIEITPEQLKAECERIDSSTRAPEMLEQLKSALGNDQVRFAETVAKPIVVDRLLRQRFFDDAAIHRGTRSVATDLREWLITSSEDIGARMRDERFRRSIPRKFPGAQLSPPEPFLLRPRQRGTPEQVTHLQVSMPPSEPTEGKSSSSSYSIESSVQMVQVLSHPTVQQGDHAPGSLEKSIADFDPHLQRILTDQVKNHGDVSAVIDNGAVFTVFFATARDADTIHLGNFRVMKTIYKRWVQEYDLEQP